VKSIVSVDFFTVPTIRFQVLYVFVVLAHERRRILPFGVTACPTAERLAQQMREAFPWEMAPRYLLRDRDRILGVDFVNQVKAMGIQQVLGAPRSPWQRAYVERVIGTIRRECLDHVIVFNEADLSGHLRRFVDLSSESHAPGLGEGHARVTPRPKTGSRADRRDPRGRLASSSVRTSPSLNRAPVSS
jgi:transposase InsO family protein